MSKGRYGIHGGQYIPETLMNEVIKLEREYEFYKNNASFKEELDICLGNMRAGHRFCILQRR